jgi:hypothetical protein
MWLCIFYGKNPAMHTHNMIDYRESDAHTLVSASATSIDTVELFLHVWEICLRYTDTIVDEGEDYMCISLFVVTREDTMRTSIFDKIREYVMYNLREH